MDVEAELEFYLAERAVPPCKYARLVPDDLKVLIRNRVEGEDGHKWNAISRFLAAPPRVILIDPNTIKMHFQKNHPDDR